ncbi:LOG family protein [bacterium]|nr:LOG family protein [bacterium]
MRDHLKQYIEESKTPQVRGLRILLEYFYAMEIFKPITDSGAKIVSVFGSARLKPHDEEYKKARKLGELLFNRGYAVVTGASFGIMQAANEGIADGIIKKLSKSKKYKSEKALINSTEYKEMIKRYSVGLKISLPFEPHNNPFVGVSATFHYFMVRKFFFGTLSKAFIACEGGWGTRDELFEVLTLVQTGKAPLMPISYITPDPEHILFDIQYAAKKGYINHEDIWLLDVVSDYRESVKLVDNFYRVVNKIEYDKNNNIVLTLRHTVNAADKKIVQHFLAKKSKSIFKSALFKENQIILTGFNFRSYGYLKKLIQELE